MWLSFSFSIENIFILTTIWLCGIAKTKEPQITSGQPVETYAATTLHSTSFRDNNLIHNKLQNVGLRGTLHSPTH